MRLDPGNERNNGGGRWVRAIVALNSDRIPNGSSNVLGWADGSWVAVHPWEVGCPQSPICRLRNLAVAELLN